jgi:methylglutaconyl-CoA hydratase
MSTYERIRVQTREAVCTITLSRPEKRNALDDTTVEELKSAFTAAEQDNAVRVIVLRGAGPDFCAGADLSQLERIARRRSAGQPPDASALGELLIAMRRCSARSSPLCRKRVRRRAGLATACDL